MNVLVTSGGTKVPIDKVRDITNQSNGTFGSKIASVFLTRGFNTKFLRAKDSRSPYSINIDLNKNNFDQDEIKELISFHEKTKNLYKETEFRNYSDYSSKLEFLIKNENLDVVVLTAAVSDYGVENFVDSKIRTKDSLNIQLTPVPKLISKIKEWRKDIFLVGFKMLVNVEKEELVKAARESIEKNGCDIVIANDWNSFLAGNPEMHVVTRNNVKTYNKENSVLEEIIVDEVIRSKK